MKTMKTMRFPMLVIALCLGLVAYTQQRHETFRPKAVWTDTDGNPINAHGGGILYHEGTYYWYGEYKARRSFLPQGGMRDGNANSISCYSSRDLLNWKFEGFALRTEPEDRNSDLHPSQVIERPKVVYNKKTGQFVMWFHSDSPNYARASAGVAVADTPTGPFRYLGSFRPNGSMSRDQTLFVDDDGTAYQFASSEENQTMHINRLTDDYLRPDGQFVRRFVGMAREAPAVFKHDGRYYIITSACTGWDPNKAELAVADSIMGEWRVIGNPCTGEGADRTFMGQSNYVIQTPRGYIACFDMWNKYDLGDSRYIWLPLTIDAVTGAISIPWREEWSPE